MWDARRRRSGTVELADEVFGIQPNVPVMHQVVTAQLAARRAGTQSTKTRAEVRGGGAKPFRQKGTGRARQGSIRAPQWSGGGVALGPKPRSYAQRTPKKMIRLALRSALSDRAAEGKVVVVDEWGMGRPEDQGARRRRSSALELEGRVLVVLERRRRRGLEELPQPARGAAIRKGELNAYDVLVNDWIVLQRQDDAARQRHAIARLTRERRRQGESKRRSRTAERGE